MDIAEMIKALEADIETFAAARAPHRTAIDAAQTLMAEADQASRDATARAQATHEEQGRVIADEEAAMRPLQEMIAELQGIVTKLQAELPAPAPVVEPSPVVETAPVPDVAPAPDVGEVPS